MSHLRAALVSLAVLTVVTGVVYPVVVTAIAQLVFPHQANGSLIVKDGKVVGSALIGQSFDDPKYFWGRPSATSPFGYNTKLVSKAEAPRNWDDLLHPRWKGKLLMDDEEYFWHAGMLKHWGEEKGRKYMEALSRQGLQFRNGHALLADLLSIGEFPAAVVVYPDHIEQMKAKGQTVEWVKSSDPILVNLAPVAVAARAPQPNAAKLFLNYSISKEGQEILQKARRASARHDVPPLVPDMDPRKLKLVPLDPETTNPEHVKDFRRAFGLN